MTTIDFKDAIAELLDQKYSASPKDEDFATTRSQSAIDATRRSSLRLVPGLYEAHSFENASK
jgi:hypothetical protein